MFPSCQATVQIGTHKSKDEKQTTGYQSITKTTITTDITTKIPVKEQNSRGDNINAGKDVVPKVVHMELKDDNSS